MVELRSRAIAPSVVSVALPALAGCGDDEERNTDAETGGSTDTAATEALTSPVADVVDITETDFRLTPANPIVPIGGTIEFIARNEGKVEHALDVEGPEGEVETKPIAPGKSARLKIKLERPGSYTMYCPIGNHREMGMVGKVKVRSPGTGGNPSSS